MGIGVLQWSLGVPFKVFAEIIAFSTSLDLSINSGLMSHPITCASSKELLHVLKPLFNCSQ
jgi:hypothetical protein